MDVLVHPIPILQICNVLFGMALLLWEWPVKAVMKCPSHSRTSVHITLILAASVPALLLFQATNAALYYFVAAVLYYCSYRRHESCCTCPHVISVLTYPSNGHLQPSPSLN